MSVPKIGIVISSTRAARIGEQAAEYVASVARKRTDLSFEIVDLRNYPMPFFDEVASNAYVPSTNAVAQAWQKKVASLDGFIFVTAEYNNSITAALKNALDYAYPEWNRKAAAYFSYGSAGGARAVQHLKDICVELQMAPVRQSVLIQGNDFYPIMNGQKQVKDLAGLEPQVGAMLDQLSWWATALKDARERG
ncbi:NAD(P)H-dependent oxidoreductase [Sphaerochaeta sp. PS]|uniref:NADPH-dependent FMN reductase n=1 Tax=Sphaerochaeta sp. PS TaxID=3076336 RepID=UPI0028A53BF0|nr:NAD(P)H-dependent oxidoreductase [Sphaerochaeta sp. PS]MDT4762055.1 NAD(P)H-dependent oxidoreductase [Sphaerochaeta sp. PS]